MPGSAMADWGGSPRAFSTRWRRCNCRRWATGCATNTACSGSRSRMAGSAKTRTIGCASMTRGRSPAQRKRSKSSFRSSVTMHRGQPGDRPRPSLDLDRHPVRPAGGRLWRQNHQHAAAMVGGIARLFRFSGIQQRRFCRRACRNSRGGIADAGAVSRRQHRGRAGIAVCAGIFSGRLLAGRSRAPLSSPQWRLAGCSPTRPRSS